MYKISQRGLKDCKSVWDSDYVIISIIGINGDSIYIQPFDFKLKVNVKIEIRNFASKFLF